MPDPAGSGNELLDAALGYARMGWRVFPCQTVTSDGVCTCLRGSDCKSPGKHPRIKGWTNEATTSEDVIRAWWKRWPQANIGIACGHQSGIWILDIDPRHGGPDTLHELRKGRPLPATPTSETGGGGTHYVFKHPGFNVGTTGGASVRPGIDVRGDGGLFIAWPSRHESGRQYVWEADTDPFDGTAVSDAPDWILELIAPKVKAPAATNGSAAKGPNIREVHERIPSGARNDTLFRKACGLRGMGLGEEAIYAQVSIWNRDLCDQPLPDAEIRTLCASAALKEANSVPYELRGGPPREQLPDGPPIGEWPPKVATAAQEPKGDAPPTAKKERKKRAEVHEEEPPEFQFTDLGNAKRLIHYHGKDLRFCATWGKWLSWNGRFWGVDETGGASAMQRAIKVVEGMAEEALRSEDRAKRKELLEWAGKCQARSRLDNMLALARSLEGIPVTPAELDQAREIVNVHNGTIDLRTGELGPHRREDLLTRGITYDYDPEADCPRWIKFLGEVIPDESIQRFVWKAAGYSLTGLTGEKMFFFLHGSGDNGKSLFIETLLAIFGEYARQTDSETLMVKQATGINNDVARLKEARLVASPETEEGKRLNEGLVKRLTGGDTMTARYLYQESFEFVPQFKIWVSGNHKPVIRGTDPAIWNRVALVPFSVVIPKAQQDKSLKRKFLKDEAAGILSWLVDGCLAWRKEGLIKPDAITGAVDDYREESDVLGRFLDEATYRDSKGSIRSTDLYNAYQRWCKKNNEYCRTSTKFGVAMRDRGESSQKDRQGYFYPGRLLTEEEAQDHVWRGSKD